MIDIHSHVIDKNIEVVQKLIEDMDIHGIEKRVVSTISSAPGLENVKFTEKIVKMYPSKLIGCVVLNPKNNNVLKELEYALDSEWIKMFEFNPVEHAYFPDLNEKMDYIIGKIDSKGLPIKVYTGIGRYGIPQQWEKYVKKYINTNFVFLHMGCFDYGYTCVDVVSRNKNAFTEISNQYELQILRKALEKINNKKILFGTSYPHRLTSSALKLFDTFNLTEKEKENIYSNNNSEFFRGVVDDG